MTLRSLLIAALACAATATAAQAADPRISTRLYNPDEVVVVQGRAGVQATIAFGDSEQIENVAIGDSQSWQVTPNKRANLLFVKPLGPTARTNMTVVTDRRTYLFDLSASAAAAPLYVLRFTYPPEPKTAAKVAGGLTSAEALAAATPPREVPAGQGAALNFNWKTAGAKKLYPARVYDDGQATYLAWPTGNAIPAILIRNGKGEEGAVNYAVRDDVLILDSVPELLILRSGRDTATLENQRKPQVAGAASDPGPTAVALAPAASSLSAAAPAAGVQGR